MTTPTEMAESNQQDQSAVTAVRGGDAERYRELVERHERRVFAVAWSRLGDAALAEEVTQEAFIRAYRRLWLLGDGAKFSGWVSTIARRMAINFGLRHRRELNKRERWALENFEETAPGKSAEASEPLHSPETLRQTLAELPAAHRECLVLFYLEGKSGAEAATALGISEAALRVRLHRARAALRERLEEKLEGSLEKLRPSQALLPAIMASVLASSTAKAATAGGAGAGILGVLAKFTPFKWLFMFLPLLLPIIIMLPGYWMQQRRLRDELKNYRDTGGFRARLHQQSSKKFVLRFGVMMLVIFGLIYFLHLGPVKLDIKHFYLLLSCFGLRASFVSGRLLEINRTRFQIGAFLSGLVLTGACFAVGLGWLATSAFMPFCMISVLIGISSYHQRPLRMDYNLFLRATQEMFPNHAEVPAAQTQTRESLRRFARFLGERQLAIGFRWLDDGLMLNVPRAGAQVNQSWSSYAWTSKKASAILLNTDGSVSAHCGEKDAAVLLALADSKRLDLNETENRVSTVLAQAWRHFAAGEISRAEFALGQISDDEIFVKPSAKLGSSRWTKIIFGGMIGLSLAITAATKFFPAEMERLNGLKPVAVTDAQVHEFMSLVSTNPNPLVPKVLSNGEKGFTQKSFEWDPAMALLTCLVVPDAGMFPATNWQAVLDDIAGGDGFESWRQSPYRVQGITGAPLPRRALAENIISFSDLNLSPSDLHDYLHTNRFKQYQPEHWDYFLARGESWSWVKGERFKVLRITSDGVTQLRLLRAVNCLDLVDREKLIQQIAAVQTLSEHPPGNPPIHDWRDVRGLFFTPCWPALLDTYHSIAALEILGGLDKIDREACIEGILRVHHGKGFFKSPDSGSYNEYHIDGTAQDTIAAYESLRILGALDRVNRHRLKNDEVTWRDIEAWTAQRRLQKIMQAHQANPAAPWKSLLEP
jgi:RNA polymerase sigma-70 factor (ECF subfamily)